MKKVIILDDHPIIIDGVRSLLEVSAEFELIAQAANLPELISNLAQPADLLILDLNIKGKNILDQIAAIRQRASRIKILVFSNYNAPSLVRKAFEQGVDGYLLKDTTQDELLTALTQIAEGRRFVGANVQLPKNAPPMHDATLVDDFEKKFKLTEREVGIICLMAKGMASQDIATKLFISLHTVQSHRKNIMRKLDLHSAVEIARFAIENKLV